jgi:hypothetical protein
MSKYRSIISEARKQDGKKTTNPKSSALPEPEVNLSIKVPISLRRHWVAEAKRQGTTITAAITAALTERFGQPT